MRHDEISKDRRRKAAEERKQFYNTLTLEQKIQRAEDRVGNSTKELNKLRGNK